MDTITPLPDSFLDKVFDTPTERFILANGLTVIHRPSWHAPVVSTQLWVKTGSIHEGAMLGSGLSHYLEHMLFKGSARRSASELSREVHGLGGSINAYTTYDRTVYHIDAPAEATEQCLDVLQDLVFHARLDPADCEREREVILREIDMYLDDPQDTLSRHLFQTAFRKHPYREPVIGHRPLFAKVTREELTDYYRRRYIPNNCVLVVVGAIDSDSLKALVESHFSQLPMACSGPAVADPEPGQLSPREISLTCDFQLARGCIAYRIPGLTHPQTPALDTLARALGSGESAYLWKRIRNQLGLVHEIDVLNWNPGSVGLFAIFFTCDADKLSAAESAILTALETVKNEGLPAGVVAKAIRNAVAGEIAARKTVSGQAGRLGTAEVVVGDLAYPRRYLEGLQELTEADLISCATQFLTHKATTTIRLQPADAVKIHKDKPNKQSIRSSPYKIITLKQGMPLLLQKDPSLPRVHLCAALRAGPFLEQQGARGSSQLLASLLSKDTVNHCAENVAEIMESLGASLQARSGNNALLLQMEAFPFDLPQALDMFGDALLRPTFAHRTFDTERKAQIAAIEESEDDLLEYAFMRFQQLFFDQHPLAVGIDGKREDLLKMTPASIQTLHQHLVHADNCILAVVGDFDEEPLIAQLEKVLAAMPSGKKAFSLKSSLDNLKVSPGFHPLSKNREQAVVLTGFPDPGILNEVETMRSTVLNELFSGLSSNLFETVREQQGLAYYVGATRICGLHSGSFVFYGGTHPDQATAVHSAIDAEIERVQNGLVEAAEIERCKKRIRASRAMAKQSIGNRAMEAALNKLYNEPIDDGATFNHRLQSITPTDLKEHAKKYFTTLQRLQLLIRKA